MVHNNLLVVYKFCSEPYVVYNQYLITTKTEGLVVLDMTNKYIQT